MRRDIDRRLVCHHRFQAWIRISKGALTTVHFSISAEIVRQLAPKLRPRYLVLPAERFVTEVPESVAISTADIYPDVSVAETRVAARTAQGTAIAPAPLELATIILRLSSCHG